MPQPACCGVFFSQKAESSSLLKTCILQEGNWITKLSNPGAALGQVKHLPLETGVTCSVVTPNMKEDLILRPSHSHF